MHVLHVTAEQNDASFVLSGSLRTRPKIASTSLQVASCRCIILLTETRVVGTSLYNEVMAELESIYRLAMPLKYS